MNFDPKKRFSGRVKNYVKYRPHYPKEILTFLIKECGLTESSVIADIGSGTGISSELFIENGNKVFAVEPNREMRKAAENFFSKEKNFISLNTSAESTGLSENSIDFVIAGQAFHWFDAELCNKEFIRILKKEGYVVLIWNSRVYKEGFMDDYEDLLLKFGTDYENVNHENIDEDYIKNFFNPNNYNVAKFDNHQDLDHEGIRGRLLSSSYVTDEKSPKYLPMLNALDELYFKYNIDGIVKVEYMTVVYYGKLMG
ncbi:MAG: class I SAM-dependent methyltransferase [Ignavibacteria bacterium]